MVDGGRRGHRDARAGQAVRRGQRRRRDRSRRARPAASTASSARTAPARRRRSGSSSGCSGRRAAASRIFGEPVAPGAPVLRACRLADRAAGVLPVPLGAREPPGVRDGPWPRAGRPARARVAESLDRVGLAAVARRKAGGFSTGMRQRLALATALIGRPDLVILDEPTNGLDPNGVVDVRELIARLAPDGTTVFLSSHVLPEVEQLCDRVAILRAGRIVAEGPTGDLLGAGERLFVRFDTAAEAAAALALLGPRARARRTAVAGARRSRAARRTPLAEASRDQPDARRGRAVSGGADRPAPVARGCVPRADLRPRPTADATGPVRRGRPCVAGPTSRRLVGDPMKALLRADWLRLRRRRDLWIIAIAVLRPERLVTFLAGYRCRRQPTRPGSSTDGPGPPGGPRATPTSRVGHDAGGDRCPDRPDRRRPDRPVRPAAGSNGRPSRQIDAPEVRLPPERLHRRRHRGSFPILALVLDREPRGRRRVPLRDDPDIVARRRAIAGGSSSRAWSASWP